MKIAFNLILPSITQISTYTYTYTYSVVGPTAECCGSIAAAICEVRVGG